MNTKTAYSRPEEKKVIDTETGEELTLTHTASTWADKNFQKIFINTFPTVRGRQFLRQVTDPLILQYAFSGCLAIIRDPFRLADPFQKRGFTVSFFSDQDGFVSIVQHQAEIFQNHFIIFFMCNGYMFDLYHIGPPFSGLFQKEKARFRIRKQTHANHVKPRSSS